MLRAQSRGPGTISQAHGSISFGDVITQWSEEYQGDDPGWTRLQGLAGYQDPCPSKLPSKEGLEL